MSATYIPVPDLTRQIENRDCFPSAVTDNELRQLNSAAERLSGRVMQELSNRWTESLRAEQKPAKP
jgi:hypothetical protein